MCPSWRRVGQAREKWEGGGQVWVKLAVVMVNSISTCDRRAEAIPEKNFVGLKFFPNFLNNLTKSAFTASNQRCQARVLKLCV